MLILKNGSQVKDPRLTRIVHFDERSKGYPIRAVLSSTTPRSYTWPCTTWLDQGSEGACVGFSFAHELLAAPAVVRGVDKKFAKEKIYWEAQKIDPWDGGSYPGASPYYEGTSVLAGVKAVQELGYIEEYRWAFGLEDLILAVGHSGPVVLGINWYEGMFDMMPCGFVHVTGSVAGGHAILCQGVNVSEEYFTLHNSWGTSWGDGGNAKITWKEMDQLLKEDGEACVPVVRHVTV